MIRFGFGAMLAWSVLRLIAREAMAREQSACLFRHLARERRAARWRAMFP